MELEYKEQLQQLKKENALLSMAVMGKYPNIFDELEEYKKALQWYADPFNYEDENGELVSAYKGLKMAAVAQIVLKEWNDQ